MVRESCGRRGPARGLFTAHRAVLALVAAAVWLLARPAIAQRAPAPEELRAYTGIFAAVVANDPDRIRERVAAGERVDARDGNGRTPLHVAAFLGRREAMKVLVDAGADPNALDGDRYDIVTIAAVANDLPTLDASLVLGGRATNVTSRYDGTALIAAAHLGHVEVVRRLIRAGAPLDHVNNLGWTALIESIVLGDGGPAHVATLEALVAAGASVNLASRSGKSPLQLAKDRGYRTMATILERAGAK